MADVQVRREEVPEQLTKQDLEKNVNIYLTETDMIWLFDIPTVFISTESEEAETVKYAYFIYILVLSTMLFSFSKKSEIMGYNLNQISGTGIAVQVGHGFHPAVGEQSEVSSR